MVRPPAPFEPKPARPRRRCRPPSLPAMGKRAGQLAGTGRRGAIHRTDSCRHRLRTRATLPAPIQRSRLLARRHHLLQHGADALAALQRHLPARPERRRIPPPNQSRLVRPDCQAAPSRRPRTARRRPLPVFGSRVVRAAYPVSVLHRPRHPHRCRTRPVHPAGRTGGLHRLAHRFGQPIPHAPLGDPPSAASLFPALFPRRKQPATVQHPPRFCRCAQPSAGCLRTVCQPGSLHRRSTPRRTKRPAAFLAQSRPLLAQTPP